MQSPLMVTLIDQNPPAAFPFFSLLLPSITAILRDMDTEQKLNILADSGKYDLACACKFADEPGRIRGDHGRWIYPAALPDGRKIYLLKTLQSNACSNDCSYCPFNGSRDIPRCTIEPDIIARIFMELHRKNLVNGLFLSSGMAHSPEKSMENLLKTAEILRNRHNFPGFIHLKILPGCSTPTIHTAIKLATRVSINIEAPNQARLAQLSKKKRFMEDIIRTMRLIHDYSHEIKGRVDQTTQFVVGAAGENDREIVTTTHKLYKDMQLSRVYFSAYQDLSQPAPPASQANGVEQFIREHRLYQVDFLFRKYGFEMDDISFDQGQNLPLSDDPKTIWARQHPEFFPVDINRADYYDLLRVPGIGPVSARKIVRERKKGKLSSVSDLKAMGIRTRQASDYLDLPGKERLLWE